MSKTLCRSGLKFFLLQKQEHIKVILYYLQCSITNYHWITFYIIYPSTRRKLTKNQNTIHSLLQYESTVYIIRHCRFKSKEF